MGYDSFSVTISLFTFRLILVIIRHIMKIVLPSKKPRNSLVAPARFRKAGKHSEGKTRQKQKRELQKAQPNE